MVDLKSKSAADGLLPLTSGTVTVVEVDNTPLSTLAPLRGRDAAKGLKDGHGLPWPDAGKITGKGPYAVWFGHAHVLLMGEEPDAGLSDCCAVTDQTDAWCIVDISGDNAADVLARLTPLDLRDQVFAVGDVARTDVQHMQGAILRMDRDRFRIMVFRSMARTLVHDLKTAMNSIAAQT